MNELLTTLGDIAGTYWWAIDLLLVATGLIIYVGASHSLHQRRHPAAAISWVLGIVLLPYITLPLYLAFGSRKIVAAKHAAGRHRVAASTGQTHATAARVQQLGMAMGVPDPVAYESLTVHEDGTQALNALRATIDGAKHTIEVATFLVGRDVLGDEIAERLKQRAREGVRVRLLIDGIGIYLGGYPDMKSLKAAGVNVLRFVPPFRSPKRGRTNLRNHRKMVIADGKHLWCGGRNLAAEYFEGDPRRSCAARRGSISASISLAKSPNRRGSSSKRTGRSPASSRRQRLRQKSRMEAHRLRWRNWCRAAPTGPTTPSTSC